ncbi:MAG: hypothetical protein AAF547_08825 [Actinomycetota bacterium]
MTVIALVSCSGAPGVTTVSLATTAALTGTDAPEPVMVELATSGGVLADQYDMATEPGLASLTLNLGAEETSLLAHAQELPGGVPVVIAPLSGSKVGKLLQAKVDPLAHHLKATPETVIADCGRISTTSPVLPILRHASLVGIVLRPSRQDFHLAALTLAEINEQLDAPLPAGWVLVGHNPWSSDEILDQYGMPIFTTIADDPPGAEAVAGLRRFRRRSPLARSTHAFAEDLAKHLRVSDAEAPLRYLDPNAPVTATMPPPTGPERVVDEDGAAWAADVDAVDLEDEPPDAVDLVDEALDGEDEAPADGDQPNTDGPAPDDAPANDAPAANGSDAEALAANGPPADAGDLDEAVGEFDADELAAGDLEASAP